MDRVLGSSIAKSPKMDLVLGSSIAESPKMDRVLELHLL
ncbi:hypothetical protein T235_08390 [Tannerella sp. oral taxon BU063 isolate Cell 8/11]|uniref:Uncharacterized protein n=1 Tax=Tannerella sp. oral taxon BU063 isolate Cell 8/11 TaxID=1411915 RepID=W2CZI6_9BACT|nr:hypothetical protein T235_08390 [Tannerella sp. oral taxon BU063 isolate Cell 8/11]